MNALLALISVQIRLYLSDRRALLISLAMPIVIAAFFGMLFGGKGGGDKPSAVPVALVDEDRSDVSTRIIAALSRDDALKVQPLERAAAEDLVKRGKVRAALVLPPGFGEAAARALMGGRKPTAELLYDPSEKMAVAMLRGMLAQHAMQVVMSSGFSGEAGGKRLEESLAALETAPGMDPAQRGALAKLFASVREVQQATPVPHPASGAASGASTGAAAQARGGLSLPYELGEKAIGGGLAGYNAYAQSFAGMGAQFVLFMGIELGVGILMARRAGLWLRLRAAPLSRATLLASHFCSTTIIASVVLALVMLAGMLLFGFGVQGSWPGFALVVFGYGLFTAGFGLFLASIGKSPEATRGMATLATLLLVMLGGAWVPSFVFPAWMQDLTLVVPVRWGIDGLNAMTWRGLEFGAAALAAAVLAGWAAVFGLLAWWRFDWRE